MNNKMRCPACRSAGLDLSREKAVCRACQANYPVLWGIPMLINGIDAVRVKETFLSEKKLFDSKVLGVEKFKLNYYIKAFFYKYLRMTFPKLKSQFYYWGCRGKDYMDTFFEEIFQIVAYLKERRV